MTYYQNHDPRIISNDGGRYAKIHLNENNTFVTDVETFDLISTEENGRLTYKIVGGVDRNLFTIDSKSGVLSFKNAPDFENPTDYNQDGDYHVKVKVIDGAGFTDTQHIEVIVKDVDESPVSFDPHKIDFEGDADGNRLEAGRVIDDEFLGAGITVSTNNRDKPAMIFDTANPTGGDYDLGHFPELGKVLIISEDGDSSDPDDNRRGGTLIFDFEDPRLVTNIGLLDTEEQGTIRAYDSEGNLLSTTDIPAISNGAKQDVSVNTDNVSRLEVHLNGSGALTHIGLNTAPDAVDDHASVDEGQMVVIDVLGNDTDSDGNTLTIDSVGAGPANGTVEIVNGEIKYTPDAGFTGDDTFEYKVSDGKGGTDKATVKVTVNDVNFAPDAVDDHVSVDEGQMVTIDVLGNDTDPDGDALTIESIVGAGPANGTAEIINGEIKYTPDAGFTGDDTFEYTVSDGNGGTDTATVKVTVNDVNEAPHANNDHVSVDEGQMVTIDVLGNDTDPDGDTLTIESIVGAGPANGTAEIINGEIKYTPDAGFTGDDTFEYTVSDGNGGTDTATVKVTVNDVNEAPHANNDHVSVDEGQMVTIDVLGNDTDPDGDALTIESIVGAGPANGTAEIINGEIKYTPDAGFTGDDTFEYTVSDGNGGTDTATVKVTVNDVNEAPHANNDHVSVDEGQMVTIDVLGNDTDPDGDTLTIESIVGAGPANGTAEIINGEIKYTPDAGFTGDDTFEYTVSDGNGGTDTAEVKVTVENLNGAPDAINDSASLKEGEMILIDVLANDTDPEGDTLTIDSILGDGPANGIAEIVDGQIKYTANLGFVGQDSFKYQISDGNGGVDSALIRITVNSLNGAPDAVNDTATVDEGDMVLIDVIANDTDPENDPLIVENIVGDGPANGSVEIVDNQIKYTSNLGFFGQDSFKYTVSDGNGGTDTATVRVTVNSLNGSPDAGNDTATIREGQVAVIDVLANDTDPEGDTLTIDSIVGDGPPNGTVEIIDNQVQYTPNPGFIGRDTFKYNVSDGNGGFDSATVRVTVNSLNDPPSASNDFVTLNEGEVTLIDVLANDTDPEGAALILEGIDRDPVNGTVQIVDNQAQYTPNPGFFGRDTFRYTVSDGNGGTDIATVNLTVNSLNQSPDAANDSASTNQGEAILLDVLANDSDPENDPLTVDVLDGNTPPNGTVEIIDNQILYTPNPDFIGRDTFRYTLSDGTSTDTALVRVTVNENEVVQEDPILGDGNYRLGNHPGGGAPGPDYGLRLDGLLTGDANDIFTFDFENSHSNVEMSIAGGGSQISISGTVFGGLVDPVTGEYVEGQSGSWDVDFAYSNVENLSGDDDLIVDDSLAGTNTGTITPQFGNQEVIALEDFAGQNANTFQLGDLEDDGGFRGFSGVSGWGWLQAGDNRLADSDWIFTVQEEIVH